MSWRCTTPPSGCVFWTRAPGVSPLQLSSWKTFALSAAKRAKKGGRCGSGCQQARSALKTPHPVTSSTPETGAPSRMRCPVLSCTRIAP